jgi:hypothetical protein
MAFYLDILLTKKHFPTNRFSECSNSCLKALYFTMTTSFCLRVDHTISKYFQGLKIDPTDQNPRIKTRVIVSGRGRLRLYDY